MYVKSSIPFKKRPDLEFKKSIFESSVIEIDKHVFHSRHNIITGIFYRSPNSALNTFNDSLKKLLNVIQKEKKYAYILGDLNVNTISVFLVQHYNVNNLLTHFLLIIIGNSYIYLHEFQETRSILDNIYTNHQLSEENGVIMTDITDHYSIFTVCED